MTWGQPLGLDELMIVNPGLPGDSDTLFLGEDGIYALQRDRPRLQGIGEVFLGDDGMLYQLQGYISSDSPFARKRCGCSRRSHYKPHYKRAIF